MVGVVEQKVEYGGGRGEGGRVGDDDVGGGGDVVGVDDKMR